MKSPSVHRATYTYDQISDYVPESKKLADEYLIGNVDYTIDLLVHGLKRDRIRLARNMYAGKRDPQEFKYLEENYGIGNPSDLKFIPLIKKHIDALVGIFDSNDIKFHVSCTDTQTIDVIKDEKKFLILDDMYKLIRQQTSQNITYFQEFQGKQAPKSIIDSVRLDEIKRKYELSWKSVYEIAAEAVLKFFMTDIDFDLHNKFVDMFKDLIITGETAYRVHVPEIGRNPVFTPWMPEHIFFDRIADDGSTKDATRVVAFEYLSKQEILTRYGHYLTVQEREYIVDVLDSYSSRDNNPYWGYDFISEDRVYQYVHSDGRNLIKVYHCEWLSENPVTIDSYDHVQNLHRMKRNGDRKKSKITRYRQDLYGGVRIGDDIYVSLGKVENTFRSMADPFRTRPSFFAQYNNIDKRTREPYSLMLATKDMQDQYDMLHFFRENLIANSGVDGSRLNVNSMPSFLSEDMTTRVLEVLAYRKQGVELIDSTEDDNFAHYGEFRGGADPGLLQQITATIRSIEETAYTITGVNPQFLGVIEQREAVTNVKQSINQTSVVTKPMYSRMNFVIRRALTDLVDAAKVAYKSGPRALFLLGEDGRQLFTLDPEYFIGSDYNVHITDSSEENKKIMEIREMVKQAANQGNIDQFLAIKLMTSDSLTNMTSYMTYYQNKTMQDRMTQDDLNSQMASSQDQINQLQTELDQLKAKNLALEERKIRLDEEKVRLDAEAKKEEIALKRQKQQEDNEKDKENIEIQKAELLLAQGNKAKVAKR